MRIKPDINIDISDQKEFKKALSDKEGLSMFKLIKKYIQDPKLENLKEKDIQEIIIPKSNKELRIWLKN